MLVGVWYAEAEGGEQGRSSADTAVSVLVFYFKRRL